jgi:drug/metabolite transporter (DMT)-like permease
MYPVLGRYLQTVSGLPTFGILAFGNLIILVLIGPMLLKQTRRETLKQPIVWLFTVFVVLRALTNIAAPRYTLSIYVQLITQMTPFIVILLSTLVFREKLPRFTIPAITLSLIGAVLMVGTEFNAVTNDPTRNDLLGVGLSVASALFLGTYMVLIRRTVKYQITGETLLLMQLLALVVVGSAVSALFGENWVVFTQISLKDWGLFLFFTFAVFLGANLGQIQSIRHLGAPFASSLMASRLVSALLFGALLLNERLESVWQVIGAGIVLVTITWYLWQQRQVPHTP